MAPRPGSDTVHVETDALREYSHKVYGHSHDFEVSAMGKGDWRAPADSMLRQMDGEYAGIGEALHSMEAPMPAAQAFWGRHDRRVRQLDYFKTRLMFSLQAIAAASGAIVQAYESTDEVNAENIRSEATFFRSPRDRRPGTLADVRKVDPDKDKPTQPGS